MVMHITIIIIMIIIIIIIIIVHLYLQGFMRIVISGIPPRYDDDVYPINTMLTEICENFNLLFLDHYHTFYDYYDNV
jgi:hypothetical protein